MAPSEVVRDTDQPFGMSDDRLLAEITDRWLMVVVSLKQQPGRIITALALRKDPKQWKP